MNLPEMNNAKLNNVFHYVVMFPIAYLIGLLDKAQGYNLVQDKYIAFPICVFIATGVFGGIIEGAVKLVMGSKMDKKDVLRYAIGGLLGALTYVLYPAHTWVLYASGIPAAIVSILTLAHYWKVKKGQK